jgi:hypothetical protein
MPNVAISLHASAQQRVAPVSRVRDLDSSIARFVAVAISIASTKLMNLADCPHEPILFGHFTPGISGL